MHGNCCFLSTLTLGGTFCHKRLVSWHWRALTRLYTKTSIEDVVHVKFLGISNPYYIVLYSDALIKLPFACCLCVLIMRCQNVGGVLASFRFGRGPKIEFWALSSRGNKIWYKDLVQKSECMQGMPLGYNNSINSFWSPPPFKYVLKVISRFSWRC